jgi:hypothetical protein
VDDVVVNLKKEVEGLREKLRVTVDNEIIPLEVNQEDAQTEKKEEINANNRE